MGFSWSSAIAQDVSVRVLCDTGLDESCILSDPHQLPLSHEELALILLDALEQVQVEREPRERK